MNVELGVFIMVKLRTARNKGSCMEYDCLESLQAVYPDAYLTKQRGFQLQWDIQDDKAKIVFECKRLKAMSWNQAEKFFNKLSLLAPKQYKYYLLFKSNQQPCLVMYRETTLIGSLQFIGVIKVEKFETFFKTKFVKHTPIKRVKR